MNYFKIPRLVPLAALVLGAVGATPALAQPVCAGLPTHAALTTALAAVVGPTNTGLGNDMWATVVNRDGVVCVVTFSGGDSGAQWPGSRVISAQKANTANAFSLPAGAGGIFPGLALSTANLWAATQPGGSLFGLQFSNPVSDAVAFGGPSAADKTTQNYGLPNDPLVGRLIGGVNVFGGGLGLYGEGGVLLGALGLSGDTSCSDHIQAWKVRFGLGGVDFVPAGVAEGPPATFTDNIIFDLVTVTIDGLERLPLSAGGFGHPTCLDAAAEEAAAAALPINFPVSAINGP